METETRNPCKADWERRERAARDCGLTEDMGGGMSRRIQFEVGYDHRAHPEACGGGGHGRHGMSVRFVLRGPRGAVQLLLYMNNWVPGNVRYGDVQADSNTSLWLVPSISRDLGDGTAADLGHHAVEPTYEGEGRSECDLLPVGWCYYDGSGLNAEPLLGAFLEHGPHAVWASLARYYQEVLA